MPNPDGMGMFFYKKSNDPYGRGASLRRLDCECGFHNFIEQPFDMHNGKDQTTVVWTYSCVICTRMHTFRRQLQRSDHANG